MTESEPQEPKAEEKGASEILLEELNAGPPAELSTGRRILLTLRIPILAIITGLFVGGIIIFLSTDDVVSSMTTDPVFAVSTGLGAVVDSYVALFTGSLGDPIRIINALLGDDALEIRRAFNPISESLVNSVPFIYAGLAVALGFRVGLFNIGAEGQLFIGATTGVIAGFALRGLPPVIHIPLTVMAGAAGGAAWGFVPGWLKARTGAHEVINTIMMNFIAFRLVELLLRTVLQRPDSFNPVSPFIQDSARLPRFFEHPIRFHAGFFIALGVAYLVYWFLFKSTWGFSLRMVGSNPNAARYAGIKTGAAIIAAMSISGALAGLAGINEVQGLNFHLAVAFSSGYGFDSIAIALLGRSHPLGVVLAALLFGILRTGATSMQLAAGIPIDIIQILQAMILVFIAAPAIIRTLYRLKTPSISEEGGVFARGWGGD